LGHQGEHGVPRFSGEMFFFTVVEMLGNLGEDFVVGDFLEERVSPDVL